MRLGHFQRRGSIASALVANVSPAGKQARGRAAEARLVRWLPCKAAEEQPWLWLCYHSGTVLPASAALPPLLAVDSASVRRRR